MLGNGSDQSARTTMVGRVHQRLECYVAAHFKLGRLRSQLTRRGALAQEMLDPQPAKNIGRRTVTHTNRVGTRVHQRLESSHGAQAGAAPPRTRTSPGGCTMGVVCAWDARPAIPTAITCGSGPCDADLLGDWSSESSSPPCIAPPGSPRVPSVPHVPNRQAGGAAASSARRGQDPAASVVDFVNYVDTPPL